MKHTIKSRALIEIAYLKKWGFEIEEEFNFPESLISKIHQFIFDNLEFEAIQEELPFGQSWENETLLKGLNILAKEQQLKSFAAIDDYFSRKKEKLFST